MDRIDSGHLDPGKKRVLLVDDHPVVRRGLAELIAKEPDLEVCGEAADAYRALCLVKETSPHLVMVDLSLKAGHGIDLIEQIHALPGAVKMLVLSIHDEMLFAERVLRAGAMGYVSKEESPEMVIEAIRQVLAGEPRVSPRVAARLVHIVVGGRPLLHDPMQNLSNRELEVFEMIGQGLTTLEIARTLRLSGKTIETHRESLKSKLKITTAAELTRSAVQWVLEKRGRGVPRY